MSPSFGFRKTYQGSSDTAGKLKGRGSLTSLDGRDNAVVSLGLLKRRAGPEGSKIKDLRIDTRSSCSALVLRQIDSPDSPESLDSPNSPGSPGSPDSPDTPNVSRVGSSQGTRQRSTMLIVRGSPKSSNNPGSPSGPDSPKISQAGSNPGPTQGAILGAAEPPSPASPASPASTTVSSFPPAATSTTTAPATTSLATAPPPPPPPPPPTTTTATKSESFTSTTSTSSLSASQTPSSETSSVTSSVSSISTEGPSTALATLAPLITASSTFSTSKTSSSSAIRTLSKASSTEGVTLETTIAAPGVSPDPTSTVEAIPAVTSSSDATGVVQKGIKSDSGNVSIHIVFPVVFSVGVIAAIALILWLKRRRIRAAEDKAILSADAAPMGRQDLPRPVQGQNQQFRSDGSVMADLMDAAYAAENGGRYRQSQLSNHQGPNASLDEKRNYPEANGPPTLALPRSNGTPIFSWLGGLRSGAPTVRGSVAPPRSEMSLTDRSTVMGWPRGFAPADPKAHPLPANTRYLSYWSESSQGIPPNAMSPPPVPAVPGGMAYQPAQGRHLTTTARLEVRPLQLPPSPTETAITQNTAAMTESTWITWGIEQHPRDNQAANKKEAWGKLKSAVTGGR